jgi:gliding motility-associated-like protein
VKENFNIEELFKQKFDNFQPDVDPSVWANVQAGIGAGTAGAVSGGIAAAVKIGLISGGIIAASVATWYFGFYEPETPAQNIAEQTVISEPVQDPAQTNDPLIIVTDVNEISTTEIPTDERINAEPTNNGQQTTSAVNNTNTTGTSNPVNPVNNTVTQNNNSNGSNVGSGSLQTTTHSTGTNNENPETPITTVEPTVTDTDPEIQETEMLSTASIDLVPNVFTPDGDQNNDVFFVKSTNIESFFIVFRDRNGKEVFKTNDKDFVWDGTDLSGEKLEKGAYAYFIFAEGKDGKVIKLTGQIHIQ